MPAYTSMFVTPDQSQDRGWISDLGDSLRSGGAAIGGAIVGGITAGGEGLRTVVEAAPGAAQAVQDSVADFFAGLPEAGRRIGAAGHAISESFENTRVALSGGPGDMSEFVATSSTFGVEEAINILLTGSDPDEVTDFAERRDELEPLFDIELTEDQQVIAGAIAVVVIGAIIIATAPVSLPLLASGGLGLVLAGSVGMSVFVAWEMFGDEFWNVLGEIGELNPRGV